MTALLVVVFDGLRPDMMTPHDTPNLLRFAAMGTRFAAARSVFPSETRVCTSSVVTGCYPDRHGLVANRFVHPHHPTRIVQTGSMAVLRALEQDTGSPILQVPTLATLLAGAGADYAVLSSGTTGQTYLLNPVADALGQTVLSAHGPDACSAAGRRLLAGLPPPPQQATARAVWIAEAARTRILPQPPALTVLWLCEPDTAGHHHGLGSATQRDALRTVDAAFGRILDDWQAGPQRDTLQVMVASDHGHATVAGHVDVAQALAAVPGLAGCTVLAGSSGGIVVPDGDPGRIAAAADWLMRQDWVGNVLATSAGPLPDGVLPRAAVRLDHPRAASVLYTLRADAGPSALGLPGTTLYDGDLAMGAGTHGGLSRAELAIVMLLAGSRIRHRTVSARPAGLPDIAPTALALLDLPGGDAMDGRVLTEALADQAPPSHPTIQDEVQASSPHYAQHLARTRMGPHVWLDGATRL